MFGISTEDIEDLKQKMGKRGMSETDIAQKYDRHYSYFVRKCRRAIPEPVKLLTQLELVRAVAQGVLV